MELTNIKDFERKVSTGELVVVDFHATWCGPCKMLGPVVDKIAKEHEEFNIIKVNIDNFPELTEKFKVQTVPTIIFIKNKEEIERHSGFLPEAQLLSKIETHK